MANSRDFIEPKVPRNVSSLTTSWDAASGVNWKPSRLLVHDSSAGEAKLCDPGNTDSHKVLPVGILWVDLDTRTEFDASGTDVDGNDFVRADVFIHSFTADVDVSEVFYTDSSPSGTTPSIDSPSEGDYVLKNYANNDGKMVAHPPSDVDTLINTDSEFTDEEFPGMKVGRVVREAGSNGIARVRFNID